MRLDGFFASNAWRKLAYRQLCVAFVADISNYNFGMFRLFHLETLEWLTPENAPAKIAERRALTMAKINYQKIPGKIAAGAALVALLGASAATLTLDTIADYEGYVPEAYQDPVGIWTKCWGDTTDVTPGKTYSFDECVRSLNTHTLELARPVVKCVPGLSEQPDLVKAAFVSMAYNIGSGAFCKSSVARYANAGNWESACSRMADIYKTARGKELPGLVKRRKAESEMCLRGLREKGR